MAIVRLSGSGKAVLFVGDDGTVFMTSKSGLSKLLLGELRVPFLLLSRLPFKVSKDRFKVSPVWSGDVKAEVIRDKVNSDVVSSDVFSPKVKDAKDNKLMFDDKQVW